MIWPQQPKNFPTTGQHTRPRASNFATPSGKSATDVQFKRKASEVQEGLSTHREHTRRITNEHDRAEGHVNDGIGSLGQALQAAAKTTHSLTCGVPDRESNEIKCLRVRSHLGSSNFLFKRARCFSPSRAFLVLSCPSVYNPVL